MEPAITRHKQQERAPRMSTTRVAIAGLGAIGRVLARKLADGMPGLVLAWGGGRGSAKKKTQP
jgi:glutamate dehydrogenase/leucine dehydrogenase